MNSQATYTGIFLLTSNERRLDFLDGISLRSGLDIDYLFFREKFPGCLSNFLSYLSKSLIAVRPLSNWSSNSRYYSKFAKQYLYHLYIDRTQKDRNDQCFSRMMLL